ncbi:MAG: serine/threonine-protein kinase [Kofleriaceae bacterium]
MDVIGQVFDERYRVEERLGSGAMGIVFRARHVKLAARTFAIKILHPSLVSNDKLRRRFEREAEVAATLRHPNVVGVIDVGKTPDGKLYIVMEYADGAPLSHTLGDAAIPAPRALHIIRQLCDGLHHAHEAGLIHRDFKPDNIILEHDRAGNEMVRIVDFGIALLRDDVLESSRERLTTAGVVLGTPHYMAPEQALGNAIDHRIDLFALGVICFEMLTGKMPFEGDGVDVARANLTTDTPAMNVRVPFLRVDPLLEVFTRKLMARDRDRRIPSAKAARDLLDLIEHDRDAAAIALGLASPKLAEPLPRAATNHPEVMVATTVQPPDDLFDEPLPRPRSPRRYAIAAGIASVALAAILVAGTRAPRVEAATVEPPAEHATTARSLPLAWPVRATVSIEAPPPLHPVQITAKLPTRAPAIRTIEVAAPAEPTANEVAQHYARVARAIDGLQKTRGRDATIELWPRFRYIRIQEAITTAPLRREASKLLAQLERDITNASGAAR